MSVFITSYQYKICLHKQFKALLDARRLWNDVLQTSKNKKGQTTSSTMQVIFLPASTCFCSKYFHQKILWRLHSYAVSNFREHNQIPICMIHRKRLKEKHVVFQLGDYRRLLNKGKSCRYFAVIKRLHIFLLHILSENMYTLNNVEKNQPSKNLWIEQSCVNIVLHFTSRVCLMFFFLT